MIDDIAYQNRLASFLTSKQLDPASAWPGAPPMLGVDFLPHIFTVSGTQGAIGRAYMNPDESLMHDPSNSERMRKLPNVCEQGSLQRRTSSGTSPPNKGRTRQQNRSPKS
jgi:hypothetical protein